MRGRSLVGVGRGRHSLAPLAAHTRPLIERAVPPILRWAQKTTAGELQANVVVGDMVRLTVLRQVSSHVRSWIHELDHGSMNYLSLSSARSVVALGRVPFTQA